MNLTANHLVSNVSAPNRLKPFQQEGVEFALARNATLIADEMGL